MSTTQLQVGDTVYTREMQWSGGARHHIVREHTVTRIGRVYAYVKEYDREVGFRLDNGYERTEYRARTFYTRAQLDDLQQQVQDAERLAALVTDLPGNTRWFRDLPAGKRAAILTALED